MKPIRAKRHFTPGQGELFGLDHIASVYQSTPDNAISNAALYSLVSQKAGVPFSVIDERVPVGKSGQKHSLARRAIRWGQQDLKRQGILERVKGERGVWRLTEAAKRDLHAAKSGVKLLGFRTDLGIAVWGPSGDIFKNLHVPISLVYSFVSEYSDQGDRNHSHPRTMPSLTLKRHLTSVRVAGGGTTKSRRVQPATPQLRMRRRPCANPSDFRAMYLPVRPLCFPSTHLKILWTLLYPLPRDVTLALANRRWSRSH